jgi:hypothetical protein
MIDRKNYSLGWLLAGVLTVTVIFNGIALALNETFSIEAQNRPATSVNATQPQLVSLASPS